jgi:hypothetical protein
MFYSGTFTYLLVPILSISLLIVHCSMHQIDDDSFYPHSREPLYSMLLLSVTHDSSPARNNMRAYL